MPCSARPRRGLARCWAAGLHAHRPVPLTAVAGGDRGGGARAGMGACGQGVALSNLFFMIMLIQQLISCGIRMIMVCDTVPPGHPGRNGHAGPARKPGAPKLTALGVRQGITHGFN